MGRVEWVLAGVLASGAATLVVGSQTRDLPPAPAAAAGTARLSGRVIVVSTSGAPLPVRRARVTLESAALGDPRTTDTDTDGRYEFGGLPGGTFRITAEKAGYVLAGDGGRDVKGRAHVVDVAAAGRQTADVTLERAAAVEGRIIAAAGDPAVNIVVSAVRLAFGPRGRQLRVVSQARTDDLGRFRVHTLPPGEYLLHAAVDPLAPYSDALAPGEKPPIFARTYYPGTPRLDEARTLALTAGEETRGLDFPLTGVPVVAVGGRVVDATGKPVAAYAIRVQAAGGPAGDVRGFLTPGGGFSFSFVPPGDYWVLASAVPVPGAEAQFAAEPLTVAGRDIDDLRITLAAGASVTGRVEADGRTPVPPGLGVVTIETAYDMPAPPGAPAAVPARAGSDGAFAMSGLVGPRLVRIDRLPAAWAIKGIWVDGVDVSDAPVDFALNRRYTLRIVVSAATGSVTGVVQNSRGQPSRGRVIVYAKDERRWGARSRFIKSVEASADGAYAVEGLLPGDYVVSAVADLDDGTWEDPDVLRRLIPSATPVSVGAKETVRLVLRVSGRP